VRDPKEQRECDESTESANDGVGWREQGKALIENRLRAILRIGPVKRRLDRKSRSGRFELESQTLADF
jgi:hypothetical protein